jgi:hypothetical protein
MRFSFYVGSEANGGTALSRLVIPRATKSDGGTYSCSLSKHSTVQVRVQILNGKLLAMQDNIACSESR